MDRGCYSHIPWPLNKVQKNNMKNYPVSLACITLRLPFHDKLALTLRHIWQVEEKWSFYNVLNKHLLLDCLLCFTGFDTVEVYWHVYCKLCLNDCFVCYAVLNYTVFLSASTAQRLIGISCFRLIKNTWLRKEKKKTIVARLPLVFWNCILEYLLKFISFFCHYRRARKSHRRA